MKPRHPIASLDARQTPATAARCQLLTVSGLILAVALLVIFALVIATR